jgi:hypothetical protein
MLLNQISGRAPDAAPSAEPEFGITATFSIAAVDPETGVCGAAVASKYPAVGSVVPYVRGGVGAFCTQHWHNPKFGDKALDLLADGKPPEEVLTELLRGVRAGSGSWASLTPKDGRPIAIPPGPKSSEYWGP